MCRFYNFSLQDVMNMTLRQFGGMLEEIANVLKMETGDGDTPASLTGNQGFALAQRIFPRGRR